MVKWFGDAAGLQLGHHVASRLCRMFSRARNKLEKINRYVTDNQQTAHALSALADKKSGLIGIECKCCR
jgi:hypothetical protein